MYNFILFNKLTTYLFKIIISLLILFLLNFFIFIYSSLFSSNSLFFYIISKSIVISPYSYTITEFFDYLITFKYLSTLKILAYSIYLKYLTSFYLFIFFLLIILIGILLITFDKNELYKTGNIILLVKNEK